MPSATNQLASPGANLSKVIQLIYLCAIQAAVNKSCKTLNHISYLSGDPDNDQHLNPFQTFLCKLAQICDTMKGGDTITALVVHKAAHGPGYLFASNNRKDFELRGTQVFLTELLDNVGRNPERLGEKAMQKQILWRALEFGFPKVKYYIKRVAALIDDCMDICKQNREHHVLLQQLQQIEARAKFPQDMLSWGNARNKFLRDCETLIKAIQFTKENGVGMAIEKRTHDDDPQISHIWCELRHYFGRLHSYRRAAECIYKASRDWPEMFKGFTVNFIPSGRHPKLSLPKPRPESNQVIKVAFPDMNMAEYHDHLETLQQNELDKNIQDELPQRSVARNVHCEVLLHNFLVRNDTVDATEYWNDSMFIATSKPPCRLCHYYFSDNDNDFQVQSSHLNVYSRWRLPDLYKGQGADAAELQEELLDDIIEKMQIDTLRIVEQKLPQGKRNDSRTDSRTMGSVMSSYVDLGRDHVPGRNSARFVADSGGYGRPYDGDANSEISSVVDFDEDDFNSSSTPGAAV